MNRKRVTFTTDAEVWEHVNKLLKEKGYPLGTMGHYLTHCIDNLAVQLEHTDGKQLKLLLDI